MAKAITMRHFYDDEWCKDENATSQERLQEIAVQIRKNCRLAEYKVPTNTRDGIGSDTVCFIYVNDALGIKYWVKDKFGRISEIDEARELG